MLLLLLTWNPLKQEVKKRVRRGVEGLEQQSVKDRVKLLRVAEVRKLLSSLGEQSFLQQHSLFHKLHIITSPPLPPSPPPPVSSPSVRQAFGAPLLKTLAARRPEKT